MKKYLLTFAFLILLGSFSFAADEETDSAEAVNQLTEEQQADLIERINYLHGNGPVPASLEHLTHPICGTHTAFQYFLNKDKFDARFKGMLPQDDRYPELTITYDSPEGLFKVHYVTSGTDAVFMPLVDTIPLGGDGIPDYVNKTAEIADSVWNFQIDSLGFTAPPSDNPSGGDGLYDIYILELGSTYYGATYPDIVITAQSATSYFVMDNDYNFAPYNEFAGTPQDMDRRLDAVRVTLAHEFNHSIHFGMDYTDYEGTVSNPRLYWWEMSATYMEEAMYDNVNDYYGYLPYYLATPWKSLRYFVNGSLFPYGACLFPIFLSEKFDDVAVTRKIWERCRDLGVGPDFPQAVDATIREISGDTYDLVSAMREFATWNLFTGSRTGLAPAGVGYSEAANYPRIPDSCLFLFDDFPIYYYRDSVEINFGVRRPEVLGANYLDIRNLSLIADTFQFRFLVLPTSGAIWNISQVGIPLDGVSDATIYHNRFAGPGAEYYAVPEYEDYLRLIHIITPVSLSFTETNYNNKFDYSFYVLDTVEVGDTTYYFTNVFPNPVMAANGDEQVTFRVQKPVADIPPLNFEITIYNVAGEVVRKLSFIDWPGIYLDAAWDLKNSSGKEVAAGVYMAFARMTMADGSEVTRKYKLAVLR